MWSFPRERESFPGKWNPYPGMTKGKPAIWEVWWTHPLEFTPNIQRISGPDNHKSLRSISIIHRIRSDLCPMSVERRFQSMRWTLHLGNASLTFARNGARRSLATNRISSGGYPEDIRPANKCRSNFDVKPILHQRFSNTMSILKGKQGCQTLTWSHLCMT